MFIGFAAVEMGVMSSGLLVLIFTFWRITCQKNVHSGSNCFPFAHIAGKFAHDGTESAG